MKILLFQCLSIYKSCLSVHKLKMFYTLVNVCSMSQRHSSFHMPASLIYIYREGLLLEALPLFQDIYLKRTENKTVLLLCFLNITKLH